MSNRKARTLAAYTPTDMPDKVKSPRIVAVVDPRTMEKMDAIQAALTEEDSRYKMRVNVITVMIHKTFKDLGLELPDYEEGE